MLRNVGNMYFYDIYMIIIKFYKIKYSFSMFNVLIKHNVVNFLSSKSDLREQRKQNIPVRPLHWILPLHWKQVVTSLEKILGRKL